MNENDKLSHLRLGTFKHLKLIIVSKKNELRGAGEEIATMMMRPKESNYVSLVKKRMLKKIETQKNDEDDDETFTRQRMFLYTKKHVVHFISSWKC